MQSIDVARVLHDALVLAIELSAPALLSALGVGVLVSFVQAITQVNETTLAFVPKILAVGFSLMFGGAFMYSTIRTFTLHIFDLMIAAGGS